MKTHNYLLAAILFLLSGCLPDNNQPKEMNTVQTAAADPLEKLRAQVKEAHKELQKDPETLLNLALIHWRFEQEEEFDVIYAKHKVLRYFLLLESETFRQYAAKKNIPEQVFDSLTVNAWVDWDGLYGK